MREIVLDGTGGVASSAGKMRFAGAAALVVAYCAGMLDLVVLPVWVGALVERYGFPPQQAGGLATLFLLGAVASSVIAAPRLNSLNQRLTAAGGFVVAAVAFLLAAIRTDFFSLAALHLIAGLAVGTALSMILGTMGHSANPHRLFALAGMSLGLFAIGMLGGVPHVIIAFGGPALFQVFGAVMLVAALICSTAFPNPPALEVQTLPPFDPAIWLTLIGAGLMTFNQAMVFAFVEVIGNARGFNADGVRAALIALGIVNFVGPAPLAALLQHRLPARRVAQFGPAVQAVLALIVTSATFFPLWAPAAAIFVAVQIFTHTFVFGLLSRLDRTGRAAAAMPATLLIGAALGPIAGGALAENLGFGALGAAAVTVAALAILFFTKVRR